MWELFSGRSRGSVAAATLLARRVEDSGRWERTRCAVRGRASREAGRHLVVGSASRCSRRPSGCRSCRRPRPRSARASCRRGRRTRSRTPRRWCRRTRHELLEGAAEKSLSDVREECLRTKAKSKPDDRHKRIHAERRLTQHKDSEGAWKAFLRGPIEAQAEFKAAHEPILDELFKQARADGKHEPREAYAFDALIEMARRAMGKTTRPTPSPARSRSGRPRSASGSCASISKHCCAGGSRVTRRARSAASDRSRSPVRVSCSATRS